MKKGRVLGGLGALAVALLALGLSFRAATLDTAGGEPGPKLPTPMRTEGVSLHAIKAGRMGSTAAMAYRGGGFADARVFGMGAILVHHPLGCLIFDTGFGKDVDQHVKTTPLLMRLTSSYDKEPTVAEQVAAAGIGKDDLLGIVLTHAHWDHVSGIPDLPGVPVLVNLEELQYIRGGDASTKLARSFHDVSYRQYRYNGGPYAGFERSLDLFNDGSVVLVPAGGHTPGSVIAFINTSEGGRYALVGDLVWQKEGVDLPAERPWVSRMLVDADPARVRHLLVQLHRLQQTNPELVIVPAHDRRVWDRLPPLTSVK
ncbi:MBL fold metallo-hydrolase [Solimonas sp. K1W22B-7]|uniref:MBL fold metallo-hydrolase n=1 Tax=Solimonas sp. K1W22B-7 TaxID=2303331 RepID=UPI000E32D870|nr:MBL fold metallo-hydrolase [Solimonas sp. K1W22B-7]AXQ29997.1 MBL fold metallo-hydrolase [Solimonas sp. K1W22B-7]